MSGVFRVGKVARYRLLRGGGKESQNSHNQNHYYYTWTEITSLVNISFHDTGLDLS